MQNYFIDNHVTVEVHLDQLNNVIRSIKEEYQDLLYDHEWQKKFNNGKFFPQDINSKRIKIKLEKPKREISKRSSWKWRTSSMKKRKHKQKKNIPGWSISKNHSTLYAGKESSDGIKRMRSCTTVNE